MQRDLMSSLVEWKSRPNRKPLVIRGARQTGKSWLMREFARQEFRDSVTIDFLMDESARTLFSQDLDPKRIISEIELRYGRSIDPEETLLIFDEIQEAPRGLTSLKYFCEQAREYHVVAAGSYMGISMRREGESFPVGKVDELVLHPMCFGEFLRATSGDPVADALAQADMVKLAPLRDMLTQRLKEYLVVGGMPEAVDLFRSTGDLSEVRRVQNQILEGYASDFAKHAPGRIVERMRLVWKSLPSQLARENKKFVYGAVRPGARARDFEESLQWLFDYGAVTKVPRVSSLKMPLEAYEDLSGFKLFCVDVGLLCALSDLNPSAVLDGSRLFTEFKGSLTEQYVLEELVCKGFAPVYWSSSTGTAETDFVIPMDEKVVPIEVKAGENLRSKSLKVACDKFALSRAVRTSLSTYRDEGWLVNIPLWAIGEIRELV
ncbi:MAG: ATP-binding protein [Coriobacteriaceae bacterium]|nr:MAG: ATP-binding protein [Coriobacteriaceae bacterium]